MLETCCLSCVTVRSDIMQRAVHLSKNFGTMQFQSIIRSTFSDCESRFENRVLYKSDRVERDTIPARYVTRLRMLHSWSWAAEM